MRFFGSACGDMGGSLTKANDLMWFPGLVDGTCRADRVRPHVEGGEDLHGDGEDLFTGTVKIFTGTVVGVGR